MQIEFSKLTKVEVLTKKEFSEKYANGISIPAIDYAMTNGLIDWTQIGREKFIVMTELTKQYSPNVHPSRI